MKHILVCTALLVFTLCASAQSRFVIQRGSQLLVYNRLDTLLVHSEDGDIVYLPGGSISGDFAIDASIQLIGVGHNPDSTQATLPTRFTGDLSIQTSNVLLAGLRVEDYVYLPMSESNIVIDRCSIHNIRTSGSVEQSSGLVLTNSIFTGVSFDLLIWDDVLITHCIIYDVDRLNDAFVEHSLVHVSFTWSVSSSSFRNNAIQSSTTPTLTGATEWSHNLFVGSVPSYAIGSSNQAIPSLGSCMVSPGGTTFSYANNYHTLPGSLAENGATDGTDIGIDGGLYPWEEGSVPHNPHVYVMDIAPGTDPSGNLPVHIRANAQQR